MQESTASVDHNLDTHASVDHASTQEIPELHDVFDYNPFLHSVKDMPRTTTLAPSVQEVNVDPRLPDVSSNSGKLIWLLMYCVGINLEWSPIIFYF